MMMSNEELHVTKSSHQVGESREEKREICTLQFDGSCSSNGIGARMLLICPKGVM